MDKHELGLLAKKYMDGTASDVEKARLAQWYDTIHDDSTEEVLIENDESREDIKQRMLSNIRYELNMAPQATGLSKQTVIKRLLQAASVAAILVIGFFVLKPAAIIAPVQQTESRTVNVPLNRVLHITLPDGSRVWLNAGSIFKYAKNFNGKTREVELVEGRAFFDIKHKADHPFIVKTKNLNVTVLGTSFDVRSYKKEGETRVSVVTGKVGITIPNSKDKKAVFLLPKQELVMSSLTNRLVKQATRKTAVNGWVKNNTMFDQENLENVFKALEKEYNTKIRVENKKLLDERISIVLGNQHLDSIIQVLSFAKHFKYQIANDSTVVIR